MNRQESFEKHWSQTHDVPVESMTQYRWKDQDGYRLPGMATAYRNFCAGWDTRIGAMPLGKFTAEVFYQVGDDPFICSIVGRVDVDSLSAAQKDLVDNPPSELDRGCGVYIFDFFHDSGQYDHMGRCEWPAGWGFDFVKFTALETELETEQ